VEAGVLRCPAADHSNDPSESQYAANAGNWSGDTSFFGDYIYNVFMGKTEQVANTAGTGYVWSTWTTDPHLAQIPGTVMLLVDCVKPNFLASVPGKHSNSSGGETGCPVGWKPYFQSWGNLVNNAATDTAEPTAINRIGTPHSSSKMCNVLWADGHVTEMNPYTQSLVPNGIGLATGGTESGNIYTYVGGPTPYTYAKGQGADFMDSYIGAPYTATLPYYQNGSVSQNGIPTQATTGGPVGNPYEYGWNKGLPYLGQ
jgi:prepilin-type processing-associated H-X9-DG protein